MQDAYRSALTKNLETRVTSTQRRMLRMIVGHARRKSVDGCEETWVEWLRRVTHEAEEQMARLQIENWVAAYKRTKWRWARRLSELPSERWTTVASNWTPALDLRTYRSVGRPKLRWTDDIEACLCSSGYGNVQWQMLARDGRLWESLEAAFVGAAAGR